MKLRDDLKKMKDEGVSEDDMMYQLWKDSLEIECRNYQQLVKEFAASSSSTSSSS